MKYFLIFFNSHCFLRKCTVKHNEKAAKSAQNLFGRFEPGQFWFGVHLVCLLVGAMVSSQQQKLRQQSLFMQGRAEPTIFFKLITMFCQNWTLVLYDLAYIYFWIIITSGFWNCVDVFIIILPPANWNGDEIWWKVRTLCLFYFLPTITVFQSIITGKLELRWGLDTK